MYRKALAAFAFATIVGTTAQAQSVELRFSAGGHPSPYDYSYTPLEIFGQEVASRSVGDMEINFFWDGQLGNVGSTIDQARGGIVDMVIASSGAITRFYPEIQVLDIPYLFEDRLIAWRVLDGEFGQMLADRIAEKTGLRPLAWFENGGFRHFSTANKRIASVEDMKGLKIRTMNSPAQMEMVRALGASPTPIGWGELYTSLQTGVVDGQENSLSTFRIPKLEEVQKYIVTDGHQYGVTAIWMNEAKFRSLSDEQRRVLTDAAAVARAANRGLSIANEVTNRRELTALGLEIVDLSHEQQAAFRDATREPVMAKITEAAGPEMVAKMLAAVESANADLGRD